MAEEARVSTPIRLLFHPPRTAGVSVRTALGMEGRPMHLTPARYCQQMGKRKFKEAIKIGLCRDPRSRIVSYYYWLTTIPKKESILRRKAQKVSGIGSNVSDVITSLGPKALHSWQFLPPQGRWLTLDGRPAWDVLIRFERLDEDWKWFQERYGVNTPLPNLNASIHPPWQECLSAKALGIVLESYKMDFDLLGYPR